MKKNQSGRDRKTESNGVKGENFKSRRLKTAPGLRNVRDDRLYTQGLRQEKPKAAEKAERGLESELEVKF